MIKKALFIIGLACLLAMLLALPVGAYYSSVSGQLLLNPGSTEPWTHGATIQAYHDCNLAPSNWVPAGSQVVTAGNWTFDFPMAVPAGNTQTCLVADFQSGPAGTPANQQFGPFTNSDSESGTKGPITFYSHTGPAAVTLQQVSTLAASGTPALIAFGVMLLGALTLVAVRRSEA